MDVQHKAPARPQQPVDVADHAPALGRPRHHAERAEQARRVVERLVAQPVQLDDVRLQALHRHPGRGRLLPGHAQHLRGQIDAQHPEAAAGERHQQPAGAAAEVDEPPRRREVLLGEAQVGGQQRGAGQGGVVVPRQGGVVQVVPEAAGDAGGKLPVGG